MARDSGKDSQIKDAAYVYCAGVTKFITMQTLREDIQKKTADLGKTALLGGRWSEKLLNFHYLQRMKNMEGGEGSQSNISLLHRTQL